MELFSKLKAKVKSIGGKIAAGATAVATVAAAPVAAMASETTASGIALDFDATQLFTYTNIITTSMMPIVYISAGFALGFTIIYALKNAFSARF
ncbi:MAG: hypothetical protein K6C97_12620 [Treponema sp.]|nr:hypothetical protein [Treponema sp.]